jgi:hypothetical protein
LYKIKEENRMPPVPEHIVIKWADLLQGNRLSDGDIIKVVSSGGISPREIEIKLELTGNVRWWKGLQASEIVLCQCQDDQRQSSAKVDYAQFSDRTFTIWKAKAFGVHTPMYTIQDQNKHMKGGNSYYFSWSQDG